MHYILKYSNKAISMIYIIYIYIHIYIYTLKGTCPVVQALVSHIQSALSRVGRVTHDRAFGALTCKGRVTHDRAFGALNYTL